MQIMEINYWKNKNTAITMMDLESLLRVSSYYLEELNTLISFDGLYNLFMSKNGSDYELEDLEYLLEDIEDHITEYNKLLDSLNNNLVDMNIQHIVNAFKDTLLKTLEILNKDLLLIKEKINEFKNTNSEQKNEETVEEYTWTEMDISENEDNKYKDDWSNDWSDYDPKYEQVQNDTPLIHIGMDSIQEITKNLEGYVSVLQKINSNRNILQEESYENLDFECINLLNKYKDATFENTIVENLVNSLREVLNNILEIILEFKEESNNTKEIILRDFLNATCSYKLTAENEIILIDKFSDICLEDIEIKDLNDLFILNNEILINFYNELYSYSNTIPKDIYKESKIKYENLLNNLEKFIFVDREISLILENLKLNLRNLIFLYEDFLNS